VTHELRTVQGWPIISSSLTLQYGKDNKSPYDWNDGEESRHGPVLSNAAVRWFRLKKLPFDHKVPTCSIHSLLPDSLGRHRNRRPLLLSANCVRQRTKPQRSEQHASTVIIFLRSPPCQSDMTGMVNTGIFPISSLGQRNGSRAPHPSGAISSQ
jgi:hypothetical protein